MRTSLLGVLVVATSTGCAATPYIVHADEALVAGDALDAGNHYFAVWRESKRTGDQAMEQRAYDGVRNATHSMLLPLFQRAEALVDQGAGAAAAELLSDPASQNSWWRSNSTSAP